MVGGSAVGTFLRAGRGGRRLRGLLLRWTSLGPCRDSVRFSSSTVVGYSCYSQRQVPTMQTEQISVDILQEPLLDWLLTCPFLCNATCTVYGRHGRRHPCRPVCSEYHGDSPVAVHRSGVRRPCWASPEDSTCAVVEETAELPQLRRFAWPRSLTCPLCSTTNAVVQRAENYEVPQLQRSFQGGRCPCCAGRDGAADTFCGYGRPVIFQRQVRVSSTVDARVSGHLVVQQRPVRSF